MMVVMHSGAYEVRFVLVIDRPELRDASFRPVKPSTRTSQTWCYTSQAAAVGAAREMLEGRWDFASEYIAAVEVVQVRGDRGRRTVRRRVERTRDETPRARRMAMVAVGGARRRAAIGADGPGIRATSATRSASHRPARPASADAAGANHGAGR